MKKIVKTIGVSCVSFCIGLGFSGIASAGEHGNGHEVGHHAHWSYSGDTGPSAWGSMKEEFHACKEGKKQSPIDITSAKATKLNDIEFHYQSFPLNVVNNGHAIQSNSAKKSYIVAGGKKFTLLQFHFHNPSENTVDGKHADAEMHLVHKADDGQLAVVAVLFNKGEGQKALGQVFHNAPSEAGETHNVEGVSVDPAALLPADHTYYRFSGSLTTPPCSEGVLWMVMKETKTISEKSLQKFQHIISGNNRPVQPLNGRVINVKE